MADFPFDIVGFDLDGTLVDSLGDIAAALNHALGLTGREPLALAAIRPLTGLGTRHLLARGLTESGGGGPEDVERLYPHLLDFYAENIAGQSRVYPGAVAALDALAALGVRCAVVTNKNESLARSLLAALGLADRCVLVIGGDTLGPGKAKPSPAPLLAMVERLGGGRAAFVGDTRFDVEAAHAAGLPCVAVDFGFASEPASALGADAVIADYAALVPTLAALGPAPVRR